MSTELGPATGQDAGGGGGEEEIISELTAYARCRPCDQCDQFEPADLERLRALKDEIGRMKTLLTTRISRSRK